MAGLGWVICVLRLPWVQVAEAGRDGGRGRRGVVGPAVAAREPPLPLLGEALLQRQQAAVLVLAEAVPEIGRRPICTYLDGMASAAGH